MSPEQAGPQPDNNPGNQSQQEQYRQLASEMRGAENTAINIGPSLAESLKKARQQAAQINGEVKPEAGVEVQALTDREILMIREAVAIANGAEVDLDQKAGRFPPWLKNAAKSASIGAIGSIAIGVAGNYAHSKGLNIPAEQSLGEAWFMLVSAYTTSRAWASSLKSKVGH